MEGVIAFGVCLMLALVVWCATDMVVAGDECPEDDGEPQDGLDAEDHAALRTWAKSDKW